MQCTNRHATAKCNKGADENKGFDEFSTYKINIQKKYYNKALNSRRKLCAARFELPPNKYLGFCLTGSSKFNLQISKVLNQIMERSLKNILKVVLFKTAKFY